jgi:hypothetical protein
MVWKSVKDSPRQHSSPGFFFLKKKKKKRDESHWSWRRMHFLAHLYKTNLNLWQVKASVCLRTWKQGGTDYCKSTGKPGGGSQSWLWRCFMLKCTSLCTVFVYVWCWVLNSEPCTLLYHRSHEAWPKLYFKYVQFIVNWCRNQYII